MGNSIVPLNELGQINFGTARSRNFYKLLVFKIHPHDQTRHKLLSLRNVSKETKLKEFQFKLIHRIEITTKELFIFGIKTDEECLYCGDIRTL